MRLIVQCEVRHISTLFKYNVEGLKLPTQITIHIFYSNISNHHKYLSKITPYWNLDEYNNNVYKWEGVIEDEHLMPIIFSPLIIFDCIKRNFNTKTLVLDHVIMLYIPKILDENTYRSTLNLPNVYYEGSPLYENKR